MGHFINCPSTESFNESLNIMNEAYFGSDILKDAQKYLTEYRADRIERKTLQRTAHPSLLKFDEEIQKIFGFYIFSLEIIEEKATNAFTMPISFRIGYNHKNKNKCQFNRKTGYKYDKDLKYCANVYIYSGLLDNPEYSDREIMAIILHEIGHNFQEVVLDYEGKIGLNFVKKNLACFLYLNQLVNNIILSVLTVNPQLVMNTVSSTVLGIFANNELFNRIINQTDRMFLNKFPQAYKQVDTLFTIVAKAKGGLTDIMSSISYVLSGLMVAANPMIILINMGVYTILGLNPVNMISLGVRYNDEKFADNFATMYGYGTETASVQKKFGQGSFGSTAQDVINNNPLLGPLFDMINAPVVATASVFDEHPNIRIRMSDQAELLRKELDRNTSNPRMKSQIKKELLEIEAIAKEFDEAQKESMNSTSFTDIQPGAYKIMMNDIYYKLFNNRDMASYLVDDVDTHEMIDKKFR